MERKNRKSGSTIFYLTLTPVQQGTRRKSTLLPSRDHAAMLLLNPRKCAIITRAQTTAKISPKHFCRPLWESTFPVLSQLEIGSGGKIVFSWAWISKQINCVFSMSCRKNVWGWLHLTESVRLPETDLLS